MRASGPRATVSFEMDGGGAHFGVYLFAQAVKLFEGFQSVLHKLIEIDRTAIPTALAQTKNLLCEWVGYLWAPSIVLWSRSELWNHGFPWAPAQHC